MASFDVGFLFTNISLNETINVNNFYNKNLYIDKLSKGGLFKLLETATSKSYFIFDYLLYKQIDREAMDAPLGPTLANALLWYYEKEWLDNRPTHFKPIIYKRYVHDIFVFFYHLKNISNFFWII